MSKQLQSQDLAFCRLGLKCISWLNLTIGLYYITMNNFIVNMNVMFFCSLVLVFIISNSNRCKIIVYLRLTSMSFLSITQNKV